MAELKNHEELYLMQMYSDVTCVEIWLWARFLIFREEEGSKVSPGDRAFL